MIHPLIAGAAIFCLSVFIAPASAAAPQETEEIDVVLRLDGNRSHGMQLFQSCGACHGADGRGAPDGDTPAIAGQYRSTVIKQLLDFRRGTRWDVRMERSADRHALAVSQDIADVAAFVSSLPVRATADRGPAAARVGHGKDVYTALCESCHRPAGIGSEGRRVPRLAGQSYQYLLRQMYYTVDHQRPNLGAPHDTLFSRFGRDEFQGLAAYLARQPDTYKPAGNSGQPGQSEAIEVHDNRAAK